MKGRRFWPAILIASTALAGCASPLGKVKRITETHQLEKRLDPDYHESEIKEEKYPLSELPRDPVSDTTQYKTPSIGRVLGVALKDYIIPQVKPGSPLYEVMQGVKYVADEIHDWTNFDFGSWEVKMDFENHDSGAGAGITASRKF